MKKIKLAVICEPAIAGVKVHVVNLLKYIDVRQFDVHFIYSDRRVDSKFFEELKEIENRGIHTTRVPMDGEIRIAEDIKAFLAIHRFIRSKRIDIVHTHSSKAGFLGRLAAKLANPQIISVHTPHAMPYHLGKRYKYLEKLASLLTDKLIAVSESERREIVSNRIIPENKIRVIYCGVVLCQESLNGDREAFKRGARIPADKTIIGTCGRISRQKDPLTFLQTIRQLLKNHENLFFLWIGDGEDRAEMENLIREWQLEAYVRITGWVEDVSKYLELLDVFVLPSAYESFGYVTCEAMSLGKPVVATRVSGTIDVVVEGKTGLLVEPQNPHQMAKQIEFLLQNPELKSKMGSLGRERVRKNFGVINSVKATHALYKAFFN